MSIEAQEDRLRADGCRVVVSLDKLDRDQLVRMVRAPTMPAWKSAIMIEEWPDREATFFLCSDENWHYYQCKGNGQILARHR